MGYYLEKNQSKDILQPHFVYSVKGDLIKPNQALADLNAKFKTEGGFIVNTTKTQEQIVRKLDAEVSFAHGKADGTVINENDVVIKIGGNTENLHFIPTPDASTIGIDVGDKQIDTPIFVKETAESTEPSKMIGRIKAESYNAVYSFDKE